MQKVQLRRETRAEGLLQVLKVSGAANVVTADPAQLVSLADAAETIIAVVQEVDLEHSNLFTLNCAVHLGGQNKSAWHQYLFCEPCGLPVRFRYGDACPQRMQLKRTSSKIRDAADSLAVREVLANFAQRLYAW